MRPPSRGVPPALALRDARRAYAARASPHDVAWGLRFRDHESTILPEMGAIFAAASRHCDIIDRLASVRADQAVRGVWFSMLRDEVRRRSAALGEQFEREVGRHESVSFKMYPVAEYLRHVVVAGALVASPERVHEGMCELHRTSVRYFARSLVGRAIVSLVRPTPLGFFQQIARSRAHIATYGRWFVEAINDDTLRIRMVDEPVYIESAQLGGVLSTLDVCGVEGTTSCELEDRFTGTVTVRWSSPKG